jgi:hypothetical protein
MTFSTIISIVELILSLGILVSPIYSSEKIFGRDFHLALFYQCSQYGCSFINFNCKSTFTTTLEYDFLLNKETLSCEHSLNCFYHSLLRVFSISIFILCCLSFQYIPLWFYNQLSISLLSSLFISFSIFNWQLNIGGDGPIPTLDVGIYVASILFFISSFSIPLREHIHPQYKSLIKTSYKGLWLVFTVLLLSILPVLIIMLNVPLFATFRKDEIVDYNNLLFKSNSNHLDAWNETTTTFALVGDTSLSVDTAMLFSITSKLKPDLLVLNGDFDYISNPKRWKEFLTSYIDPSEISILAVLGNHDEYSYKDYQYEILHLMKQTSFYDTCDGIVGAQGSCVLRNKIRFVFSSPGQYNSGHDASLFINKTLYSNSFFPICIWHKNMKKLQMSSNTGESGYEVYDMCKDYGALSIASHSHSYGRTKPMTSFQFQTVDSNYNSSWKNNVPIKKGSSIHLINGLGGRENQPDSEESMDQAWWENHFISERAHSAVLFCTLYHETNILQCRLLDSDGKTTLDDFTVQIS